jgi:hypothetical protein
MTWRTVVFSKQCKDNGTFQSLDHDWMRLFSISKTFYEAVLTFYIGQLFQAMSYPRLREFRQLDHEETGWALHMIQFLPPIT